MVKYLTLSLLVNLFLFSLYSYWVGKALQNAFGEVEKFLPPLRVTVEVATLKEEPKKVEKSERVRPQRSAPTLPFKRDFSGGGEGISEGF